MSERIDAPQGPAPSTAGASRPTGPLPLFPILGRETDIVAIIRKLDDPEVRLLTLLGTGGVGKTRLAVEVMQRAGPSFAHGARFAPLAAIDNPALVPSLLARELDIALAQGVPVEELVTQALAARHMLLVLDNLEQVADGIAPIISDILLHCPRLTILATSRVPLRVSGEYRYQVMTLDVHAASARGGDTSGPAVDLFVQRMAAVRPTRALDAESRHLAGEICRAVDGLPLAIELAAARTNVLSLAAIRARLDDRLDLLSRAERNVPARHHSLRATIAWSYDLLPEPVQRLFRRLAQFAGGFDLDAAAWIDADAGATPSTDTTLDRLGDLVDHHLLLSMEGDDEPRFAMLETIREFALDSLESSGDAGIARESHATYYLTLARRHARALAGREALGVMPYLEREIANIRAAAGWLSANGRTSDAIDMYSGLYTWLLLRGRVEEARDQFESWLEAPELDDRARAIARLRAGCLSIYLGNRARATSLVAAAKEYFRETGDKRHLAIALVLGFPVPSNASEMEQTAADCQEGLELAREIGDWHTAGSALKHLSWVQNMQGHADESIAISEEWLTLAREHGLEVDAGNAAMQLGYVRMNQGDLEGALALSREAERTFRAFDMALARHYAMMNMGEIAQELGDLPEARRWLEQAVSAARDAGAARTLAPALGTLAMVALAESDSAQALLLVQESIPLWVRFEDDFGIAGCLDLCAAIAAREGDPLHAATLLGHADAILRRVGVERMAGAEAESDTATRQRLTQKLGADDFERALSEGAALHLDEVITRATTWRIPTESAPEASAHSLTVRELEVLRLMCDGLGNVEIGLRLGITTRSATAHVTNILTRLDAPNRTAAVAWAIRNHVA